MNKIAPLKKINPELWKVGFDIVNGGAHILRSTELPPKSSRNPKYDDPKLIAKATQHLLKYIDKGSILGPFDKCHVPIDVFTSPIIVNWKKPGEKVRFIWNGSAPLGHSVNSEILQEVRRVLYPSFFQLIQIANAVGKGGFLWVADLLDAYWNIPVNKAYHGLLAGEWLGKIFIYACLPFGLATAPRIFTQFGDLLIWALHFDNKNIWSVNDILLVRHYVDDFWGGHPKKSVAIKQFNKFLYLLKELNIPTAPNKVQKPATTIIVLGFLIDTLSQSVSIAPKKAREYLNLVRQFLKSHRKLGVTPKALERLIGKLRFASAAVYGGSSFIRGLDHLLKKKRFCKKFHLDQVAIHDLRFWEVALQKYNKIPFSYVLRDRTNFHVQIFTDAATNTGFGGWDTFGNYFKGTWDKITLPKKQHEKDTLINFMELITMISFIIANRHIYKNKNLYLWIDNIAAKSWIISKRCKMKSVRFEWVSNAIRSLMIHCLKYHIYFWIEYIRSEDNKIADALSRNENHKEMLQVNKDFKIIEPKFLHNVSKSVTNVINLLCQRVFCNL